MSPYLIEAFMSPYLIEAFMSPYLIEAFMSPYLIVFSVQIWRGKDQENASKEFQQRKMGSCLSTMNPMTPLLTSYTLQIQ